MLMYVEKNNLYKINTHEIIVRVANSLKFLSTKLMY